MGAALTDDEFQASVYYVGILSDKTTDELANRANSCRWGAGDGTRTRDVQLGKLAFYH
jgi:hypothetical protein